MTYIYHVRRDNPIGLWSFDSQPLNDDSGYGANATFTGSPTTTRPIVSGGVAAQHVDSADTINYPITNIMIEGREYRAFSLEAWIKPQTGNGAILARDDSGLFLDGLNLRFSVAFGTTVSVTYTHLDAGNVYHVVGAFDGQSILLFLNGQVVASAEVDRSIVDTGFADTSSVMKTTSTGSFVIDTPAVYNYALDSSSINRHYYDGIDYPEIVNLSLNNGGKYYQFSDSHAKVYETISFGDTDSWSLGLFDVTLAEVDNKLVNLYDEASEDWLGGVWTYQYSVDVETGAGITLNGSRITWDSLGSITVETSVDGTTWTPVTNGSSIVGTQDLSTGYVISVRITLPTTTEQTYVDNLKLVFYTDKTVYGSDESLPATFVDPLTVTLAEEAYAPASFNDNLGVLLPANNGFSIPADTDFDPYNAVEMTVRFDTSTASKTVLSVGSASITTNGTGQWTFTGLSALYIDGQAVTSPATISPGMWHHVLAVFTGTTSPVYVGNSSAGTAGYPMRVGYLALYASDITSTMADAIYDAWVGTAAIRVSETAIGQISEGGFRAYAYDWSITGAG
ncbi:hypothetical protein SEA_SPARKLEGODDESS_23 [Streptomyces phage SparkleGoddess]|uniref:LamG-like jellyroll fold domain-containing protein n=2 Tax=Gilsonvirus comrade TaxID=2846395 RepID=A0A345MDV7_9CAUD|nr:hypothetical protein SEA_SPARKLEGODDESS_23 [Streptomyces phage SparkleGoddess]QQO39709.1 hypothetical protein SEA_BELFORT_24 [Streptomyces phage Belfort]UTN92279.1 hypothetical protein SEA_STIGMA_23 [Streptomyces phage Stigma]